MVMTYVDALNYALACGLTRDQAAHMVRECFGAAAISRIERTEAERSPGARKRGVVETNRRRAARLWREMRHEVLKKRNNALAAAENRPQEADYHNSYAKLCDKVLAVLSKAEAEEHKGDMRTPLQVGAARGLPNSGLHWPDWVPEHIKAHFEIAAQRVAAMRPPKARPPRPFYVPERDTAEARKRSLAVALDTQYEAAKARRALLLEKHPEPDAHTKRQLLFIASEMRACNRAMERLDAWPRTRPVPVNPMDLIDLRMATLEKVVAAQPLAFMEQVSLSDMRELAVEMVETAQKHVAKRKKYLPPADRKRAAADAQAFEKN